MRALFFRFQNRYMGTFYEKEWAHCAEDDIETFSVHLLGIFFTVFIMILTFLNKKLQDFKVDLLDGN